MADPSIRDQIIQKIQHLLGTLPVRVGAGQGVAIARDQRAAIDVDWTREIVRDVQMVHDVVGLEIRLACYAREADDAEQTADGLTVAAHKLLMADTTLGGLAQDIVSVGTMKDAQVNEHEQTTITQAYEVRYRRRSDDLTKGYP